jgi:hypothetical protein
MRGENGGMDEQKKRVSFSLKVFIVVGIVVTIGYFAYDSVHDNQPCRVSRGEWKSIYLRGPDEVADNLSAIRSRQIAFVVEWNKYVGNQPPTPVAGRVGNCDKVAWSPSTRFSILGFSPESDVRCSYSLGGSDYPGEAQGFTARAECDLDGDGNVGVWSITHVSTQITRPGAPIISSGTSF